jgi:hypothetical protein
VRPTLTVWQSGLRCGGWLSVFTLGKSFVGRCFGWPPGRGWAEALGVSAIVFVVGFVCGCLAWAGRGVARRFGLAGDAVLGLFTTLVFLSIILRLFDREMFGSRFRAETLPVLLSGVLLGPGLGILAGIDVRHARRIDPLGGDANVPRDAVSPAKPSGDRGSPDAQ